MIFFLLSVHVPLVVRHELSLVLFGLFADFQKRLKTHIHLCSYILYLETQEGDKIKGKNSFSLCTATATRGSIGGLSLRGLHVQTATHKTLCSPTLPTMAGCLPVL